MTDDLAPPASPLWRAWQGTSRANRLLAGGAVAVLVGATGGVLLAGDDDDEPVPRPTSVAASASPSVSPSPSPSPSPPAAEPSASPSSTVPPTPATPSTAPPPPSVAPRPSASPAPAPAELVLNGDDLGVTRVGAPYADAVRALTAVLGPPVADPAPDVACVESGDREVEWTGFRLAITDGVVSGWLSRDPELTTPSGVGLGTTLTELQEVYGERLERFDASPDSGPSFSVAGVQLSGGLTGPGADDRVDALWNRACSPP